MPSRKPPRTRTDSRRQPSPVPFWLATATLYAATLVLLGPTLAYPPLDLDDVSLLRELSDAPLSAAFGYDRFGHLRPAKSLLFWLVAQHPGALALTRAAVVGAFVLSVAAVQHLATGLLASRAWGLGAAACFALNPSVLSTVAWLSTSNYVLCLLFTLAFLHAASRAMQADRATRSRRLHLAAAIAGLLLAVLQHELALLAPLLLAAHPDVRRGDAPHAARVLGVAWLGAGCLELVLRLGASKPDVVYRMAEHPRWALTLSAARYVWTNLSLWLWPRASFGVLWVDDPTVHLGWSVAAWAALLLLAAGAVFLARADRTARFALVWVALFLLPVTNLFPLGLTPCAVHYLLLPGPGLALLLARGAQRAAERLRRRGRRGVVPWLPATLVGALCGAWLVDAPRALAVWADATALYAATLKNHPHNVEVRANLTGQHLQHGRLREAARLLDASLALAPHDPILVANRFELLMRTGARSAALTFLEAHPELSDDDYRFVRAELLEEHGRASDALAAFGTLATESEDPEVRFRAGVRRIKLHVDVGEPLEARRVLERLLEEFPGNPHLLFMRDLMRDEEAGAARRGPR